MLSAKVCAVVLPAFGATLGNALTVPASEGSLVSTPAPLINISLPVGTDPTRSSNDIHIECRGSQYGTNVRYTSCLDAFSTFKKGDTSNPVRIGRRNTGTGYAQNLPWKWVSGDGRCMFDITTRGRIPFDITSGQEVARAAWRLMNECVRDQGGQGGVVTGIGREGRITIMVRPYNPSNVQCGYTHETYDDDKCEPMLDIIPADVAPVRKWGPKNQPDVDVPLPFSWAATPPYVDCRLYVLGTDIERPARDEMSFYDMWEAGAIIKGMCVRFEKPGVVKRLGSRKLLWVAIDDGRGSPYSKEGDRAAALNMTGLTLGG